ncbi:unnamed protein product [Caenorhabditis angaria]|uniref:Uncharacterized protein n=1 Tax=Caenorhabditis angaria TaxID=860376 RepID=A0A9P1IH26_9PELO|nr:unnamed protein product [Caenorhabditis angaria]
MLKFCWNWRNRGLRDTIFLILFGISLGYLFGLIILTDYEIEAIEHIHITHHDDTSNFGDTFNLRCVIIIHPKAAKFEKIVETLDDGYTKLCNETIYFTNNEKFAKKWKSKSALQLVPISTSSNHFYWDFYQHVMEFSSKLPAQWTFIGDDQNYLIVPHLRKVLAKFDASRSMIFGRVKDAGSWIFPFSGATRKIAIRGGVVFTNNAIDSLSLCRGFFFPRSSEHSLYSCSQSHHVEIIDPVDEDKNRLFNDQIPMNIINPPSNPWIFGFGRKSDSHSGKISDHAISFGQCSFKDMRVMQFGMTVKVFGMAGLNKTL